MPVAPVPVSEAIISTAAQMFVLVLRQPVVLLPGGQSLILARVLDSFRRSNVHLYPSMEAGPVTHDENRVPA